MVDSVKANLLSHSHRSDTRVDSRDSSFVGFNLTPLNVISLFVLLLCMIDAVKGDEASDFCDAFDAGTNFLLTSMSTMYANLQSIFEGSYDIFTNPMNTIEQQLEMTNTTVMNWNQNGACATAPDWTGYQNTLIVLRDAMQDTKTALSSLGCTVSCIYSANQANTFFYDQQFYLANGSNLGNRLQAVLDCNRNEGMNAPACLGNNSNLIRIVPELQTTPGTQPPSQGSTASPSAGTPAPTSGTQQPAPETPSPTSGTQQPAPETPSSTSGTQQSTPGTAAPTSGTQQPAPETPSPTSGTQQSTPGTFAPTPGTQLPTSGTIALTSGTQQPSQGSTVSPSAGTQPPTPETPSPSAGTRPPTSATPIPTSRTQQPSQGSTPAPPPGTRSLNPLTSSSTPKISTSQPIPINESNPLESNSRAGASDDESWWIPLLVVVVLGAAAGIVYLVYNSIKNRKKFLDVELNQFTVSGQPGALNQIDPLDESIQQFLSEMSEEVTDRGGNKKGVFSKSEIDCLKTILSLMPYDERRTFRILFWRSSYD